MPPTGPRGTVREPSYALVGLVGVGLLALGSVVGAGVNKATTKPEPAVITTVTAEPEPAPTVTATITPEPELHTPATCVLAIEEADEFWDIVHDFVGLMDDHMKADDALLDAVAEQDVAGLNTWVEHRRELVGDIEGIASAMSGNSFGTFAE